MIHNNQLDNPYIAPQSDVPSRATPRELFNAFLGGILGGLIGSAITRMLLALTTDH